MDVLFSILGNEWVVLLDLLCSKTIRAVSFLLSAAESRLPKLGLFWMRKLGLGAVSHADKAGRAQALRRHN